MNLEIHHWLFLFAVICMIIEIFTAAFVGGSVAIGFAFAAIANYLEATTGWQIIWFVVGSGIGFFSIRYIAERWFYPEKIETNTYAGRKGVVLDQTTIQVSGQRWAFSCEDEVKKGDQIEVIDIDGSTLFVKKID